MGGPASAGGGSDASSGPTPLLLVLTPLLLVLTPLLLVFTPLLLVLTPLLVLPLDDCPPPPSEFEPFDPFDVLPQATTFPQAAKRTPDASAETAVTFIFLLSLESGRSDPALLQVGEWVR
jgi:hypothetical protein